MADPDFAERDGVALAYRYRAGREPTIVFLPGYGSDMDGTKAIALDAWAEAKGRFADATLASWRDDALALVDSLTEGPLLLVGSSMGGWLMLLVALARPERVAGLVGIAAGPDFTDWGFDQGQRDTLRRDGLLSEDSPYGPDRTILTLAMWQSGQDNRLLGREIPLACPVRLLHGQADTEVPHAVSLRLAAALRSADVHTILVKDGDHRLSRPQDIALLTAAVEALLERP